MPSTFLSICLMRINVMKKCVLSVDAGGTYLKAAFVTPEGEIIADTFITCLTTVLRQRNLLHSVR